MVKQNKYMVCVRCFTFNQAQYIEDALNGFIMQETTFPFICVIMDDASTDGEQMVITNYLGEHFALDDTATVRREETNDYTMVFAQHKTNLNCFFAVYFLKYNHKSIKRSKFEYFKQWWNSVSYYAICEGDDYWIDKTKLEKQIKFLENNHDYGLTYSNRFQLKEGKMTKCFFSGNCDFKSLLLNDEISTLTTCYRRDLYEAYQKDIQPQTKGWKMGDLPVWIYMSYYSKVKFMNDFFAVYRELPNSASHSTDIARAILFIKSGFGIRTFFVDSLVKDIERKDKLHRLVKEECYIIPAVRYYSKRGYYKEAKEVLLNDWNHTRFIIKVKCFLFLLFAFFKLKNKES